MLYISGDKVDAETKAASNKEGFDIAEYNDVEKAVKLIKGKTILDSSKLNAKLFTALNKEVKL